jgi:hypothetical protein
MESVNFLIVGTGIVGLVVAKEVLRYHAKGVRDMMSDQDPDREGGSAIVQSPPRPCFGRFFLEKTCQRINWEMG